MPLVVAMRTKFCAFRIIVTPKCEVEPRLAGMVVASAQSITELRCYSGDNIWNSKFPPPPLRHAVWQAHWPKTVLDMVLRKDQLEVQLKDEHQLIATGVLRDESPLDISPEFQKLCDACRVGDLKGCQEAIATGVNINARDYFDYTPLILVNSFDPRGCCLY
jgi:hypothetical protein